MTTDSSAALKVSAILAEIAVRRREYRRFERCGSGRLDLHSFTLPVMASR